MGDIEKALQDHTIPYQSVVDDVFFHHPLVQKVRHLIERSENPHNTYIKNQTSKIQNLSATAESLTEELRQRETVKEKAELLLNNLAGEKEEDHAQEVRQKIKDLAASFQNSTQEFIRYLKLGAPGDSHQGQSEKVTLMTLHASKGLEFKCVFIAGCEDGLLPYSLFKSQQSDREEEKRLLYVGMTRAESYLYLTHARKRSVMGQEKKLPPSPFLDQIEKELTEVAENTYQKKQTEDSQLKLF